MLSNRICLSMLINGLTPSLMFTSDPLKIIQKDCMHFVKLCECAGPEPIFWILTTGMQVNVIKR